MKMLLLIVFATLTAGAASAQIPLFAAKCGSGITTDSSPKGQLYVNGKIARLIKRPNGQVTAQSAGVFIDITPRGGEPPKITATAKGKFLGECEILSFQAPGAGSAAKGSASTKRPSTVDRAADGKFDARGPVSCAMRAGQPMRQCEAGVARDPGGTATIVITRPDGRTRFIYFEKGKATGADLSQADGSMRFRATRNNKGIYLIEAGNERYEIVDAFVFGG